MKSLILSDIHSNVYALEAIWRKESDSDLILCAGDLVDYGPFPKEVLAWVRDHADKFRCVQGNHDGWLAMNYRRGTVLDTVPPAERAWVHHNASLLDESEIQFLESLPKAITFELDGTAYGMTHMYRDYEEIVSRYAFEQFIAQMFAPLNGHSRPVSRLIMGHTHRQSVRYLADALLWMNPGSVSYRRKDDPDQAAHYATITDGKISLKRVEYDLTATHQYAMTVRLKDTELEHAQFTFGPR